MTYLKELAFTLVVAVLVVACGMEGGIDPDRKPDASYNPVLLPAAFPQSTALTNTYFPYTPARIYLYEGTSEDGAIYVKMELMNTEVDILGIPCTVFRETEWLNDHLIEVSHNWFAQDVEGTVWYMGEEVNNYNASGVLINHHGSWRAGVEDARAGIIMLADPAPGIAYRQEYFFNNAEDEAEVMATDLTVTVPYGTFTGCIKTREWSDLEPGVTEYKYYAPGIGLIKEVSPDDNEQLALIDIME